MQMSDKTLIAVPCMGPIVCICSCIAKVYQYPYPGICKLLSTSSPGGPSPPLPGMPDEDLQRLLPLDLVPGDSEGAWRWQWPPGVAYALRALAAGPATSGVASGEALGEAILDLRRELRLGRCHARLPEGLHAFFHQVRPTPRALRPTRAVPLRRLLDTLVVHPEEDQALTLFSLVCPRFCPPPCLAPSSLPPCPAWRGWRCPSLPPCARSTRQPCAATHAAATCPSASCAHSSRASSCSPRSATRTAAEQQQGCQRTVHNGNATHGLHDPLAVAVLRVRPPGADGGARRCRS